jgi:hypothetical protein
MTQDTTGAPRPRFARSLLGWTILCGVLCILGAAALEMSGSAQRLAVTNDIPAAGIVAYVPAGQKLCQPGVVVPSDGAAIQMEIFTYDKPMPTVHVTISDSSGAVVDTGTLSPGGPQGTTVIPLDDPRPVTGRLCLTATRRVALAGDPAPTGPDSQTLNGKPQPAAITVMVMRPGKESWWQLLPTVIRRFGYGKWSFLGSWTFIVGAIVLALIWVLALRTFWKDAS